MYENMLLKVSRRDNAVKTLPNYYCYALDKKKKNSIMKD